MRSRLGDAPNEQGSNTVEAALIGLPLAQQHLGKSAAHLKDGEFFAAWCAKCDAERMLRMMVKPDEVQTDLS